MTVPAPLPANLPGIVAELDAAFEEYEAALLRNDVAVLDNFFWYDESTVRYGVAENLYGGAAIREYRMQCRPVHPERRILRRIVTSYGGDCGVVNAEFIAPDDPRTGRQTQTWIRFPQGWKIVCAHVSML